MKTNRIGCLTVTRRIFSMGPIYAIGVIIIIIIKRLQLNIVDRCTGVTSAYVIV